MTIDLHTHSTASDGEHEPRELVAAAADAGVTCLGLSDHDTVAGVEEARKAGQEVGVRVIASCEFSVAVPWGEMHLLGYFLPISDPTLNGFLQTQRDNRRDRAVEMVSRLNGLGVDLTFESVSAVAGDGAIGRPHVARAVVASGAAENIDEAFDRFLGYRRPAFVAKKLPEVTVVTELISKLGGVSSAAHLRDRATGRTMRSLKRWGLDAVEVLHPSHRMELRTRIAESAARRDLLCTGGTDWHGRTMQYEGGALGEISLPEDWFAPLEALHLKRVEMDRDG